MARIAVFDSGLGSISIINAIRKIAKTEIIYFADQKNFPYGKKSKNDLQKIIHRTITSMREHFHPDLIVVASNTPSLLLPKIFSENIIGVLPPLVEAKKLTKTKQIAILGTDAITKSRELSKYVNQCLSNKVKVSKIDASELIELVESGKFIDDIELCRKKIKQLLDNKLHKIDVVTMSSTHIPFLKDILEDEYPRIKFLDPADEIANKVLRIISKTKPSQNKLKIFTSGNTKLFQKQLEKVGIDTKATKLVVI